MRILVVCQHYWPEPYRLPDLCEELVRRGHTVRVVTDVPNYPMGITYSEYRGRKNRSQQRNGVQISRTFTIARRKNVLFRILNYYSYAISSRRFVRRLGDDYDVVLAYQTSPVMMAEAAIAYAAKYRKKCVLYCLDLWPACLSAGGVRRGSWIYRLFHRVSRRIYRKADCILTSSESFPAYLSSEFSIDGSRISYVPQYADSAYLRDFSSERSSETFHVVFAGNVGAAQSMMTVMEAIRLLGNDSPIIWHIVGEGTGLAACMKFAEANALQRVIFHGFLSGEALFEQYRLADALLISFVDDPVMALTLPLKMQTYLAAGKPILASAGGEIAHVVREAQCGYVTAPEQPALLAEAVQNMRSDPMLPRYARNARAYYDAMFSRERFMDEMESCLAANAGETEAEAPEQEAVPV